MPYVEQERRPDLDVIVKLMKEKNIKANGDLNYILVKYCKEYVDASYNNFKNYKGELSEAADWIGEIFLKPYEFIKRDENGDV